MDFRKKIGNFGQKTAKEFLQKRDYLILAENYGKRTGEIDIVAKRDGQLIFIEVKTRTTEKYGLPEDAVNRKKMIKWRQAALEFIREGERTEESFRFDVMAVLMDINKRKAVIRHHKNIEFDIEENLEYN